MERLHTKPNTKDKKSRLGEAKRNPTTIGHWSLDKKVGWVKSARNPTQMINK